MARRGRAKAGAGPSSSSGSSRELGAERSRTTRSSGPGSSRTCAAGSSPGSAARLLPHGDGVRRQRGAARRPCADGRPLERGRATGRAGSSPSRSRERDSSSCRRARGASTTGSTTTPTTIALRETASASPAVEAPLARADRVLATVLFTDIVGSTERASRARRPCAGVELLDRHHAVVRRRLTQFRGEEIDTAGDGFFASFDGPGRAIECARTIWSTTCAPSVSSSASASTPASASGTTASSTGIAVPVGARVADAAAARRGARLEHREGSRRRLRASSSTIAASHELKGVPGEWRLYAVARLRRATREAVT